MAERIMHYSVRKIYKLCFCLLVLSFTFLQARFASATEQVVTALVYDFPPYYEMHEDGSYSGIGIEFLKVMSKISPDYKFQITRASPRRRHDIFKSRNIDISLFDQTEWGWQDMDIDHTEVYMHGGERYLARRQDQVDDAILFKDIKAKRLAGILGYHYFFARYQSNPTYLQARFDIALVSKQDQIIKMVQSGRVDIGVVTEAYFNAYMSKRPDLHDKLVLSDFYDQKYKFIGIRNKEAKISLDRLEALVYAAANASDFKSYMTARGFD